MSNPAAEQDPWLSDDGFNNVDFSRTPDLYTDEDLASVNDVMDPEVVANVGPPAEPEPEPVPVAEPVAPVEDEPQIVQNPDGSTISVEKSSKGWKGTVDLGNNTQPQVYYGKTKNELLMNVMTAQVHATRKIREQNHTIKLGGADTPTPQQVTTQAERATGRKLTADEAFEIKTLFESDPDKALETWFQKRTGQLPEEVASNAGRGKKADLDIIAGEESKKFLAANPEYYADAEWKNYYLLISYLSKHKLGRVLKETNKEEILASLIESGNYTATNLEEAFTELSEAGLLLLAPRTPKQPQTPAPVEPAPPAPVTERIVRTETRPRAGLGIRQTEGTSTRTPEPDKPLSVEDLNSMSDEQVAQLYAATRQQALRGRR